MAEDDNGPRGIVVEVGESAEIQIMRGMCTALEKLAVANEKSVELHQQYLPNILKAIQDNRGPPRAYLTQRSSLGSDLGNSDGEDYDELDGRDDDGERGPLGEQNSPSERDGGRRRTARGDTPRLAGRAQIGEDRCGARLRGSASNGRMGFGL